MNTINIDEIIISYLQDTEIAKQAKKRADAAKELIKQYAAGNDTFSTDIFSVIVKSTDSVRLDTKKLYQDFGEKEMKSAYGTVSTSVSLVIAEKADTEKKTA